MSPTAPTASWTVLIDAERVASICAAPTTASCVPTLVFGRLGPVVVISARTDIAQLRWAVIGLYSASDDEPAACILRPAHLQDIAVAGCVAIERDGRRRAFPEIGPFRPTMAWPLAVRMASPREAHLWTCSFDGSAGRAPEREHAAPPLPAMASDVGEADNWKQRSLLDYEHVIIGADEQPVPGERRHEPRS